MAKNKESAKETEQGTFSLKGTFISVMLVGIFIIISWFGAFALFLSR